MARKFLAGLLAFTLAGASLPWSAYAQTIRVVQPVMPGIIGIAGPLPVAQFPLGPAAVATQPQLPSSLLFPAPQALAPAVKPTLAASAKTSRAISAQAAADKQTADVLFDGLKARASKDATVDTVAAQTDTSVEGSRLSPNTQAGREALRLWVLKSVLQFGFEKDVREANKIIEKLSASRENDRPDTLKLSPTETLSFSSSGKKFIIEFTRDNGKGHKPTIIRGDYNGVSDYSLTLQFPQMSRQLVLTQSKKDPAVHALTNVEFAAWLTKQEGLEDVDALARKQLSGHDFKAWEQLKDKRGQYPAFSPRASLLGEITNAELYHLLDWNGFEERSNETGKVRLDIVYGYLGDKKLGEPDPIDLEQAHEVVQKLKAKGYQLRDDVLSKEFTYKGKSVAIEVRVTPAAISNVILTNRIAGILNQAGILAHTNIIRHILKKGAAKASMFPKNASAQQLTDAINGEIENFNRLQMSSSFKAKKAFEESLAKADVVVYDGHAGAGYGFRFGPKNVFRDHFTFAFGRLRLYIHEQIKKISKIGLIQRFLRKLSWNEDGDFYLELFTVPFLSGKAFHQQVIDPLRQRQLVFLDACRSLFLYDNLWRKLLTAHQRLMAPEQFDMVGTTSDSDTGDGVVAKLNMIDAVEKGMNAKQLVDHLRAGAVDGTKYAPGKLMGVADGTYNDVFRDPENKSHASKTPNTHSTGFIIDNNGAQVSFLKPSDRR